MRHHRRIYIKVPIDVYYEKDKPYVIVQDHKFAQEYPSLWFPTLQGRTDKFPKSFKEVMKFAKDILRYTDIQNHRNSRIIYNLKPIRFFTNRIRSAKSSQPITSITLLFFGIGIWLRKPSSDRKFKIARGKFIPGTDWNIQWINHWNHIPILPKFISMENNKEINEC